MQSLEKISLAQLNQNADMPPDGQLQGSSASMNRLNDDIRKVAPTQASVLIYGETGTGKELVARALHQQSPRAKHPFVAVNCAGLPEGLLESELFGHKRGAFTNALQDRSGRFLTANHGTLFLDEVGELSTTVQAKLLRVLQERNFEPVGSDVSIRVDIRLLAATHRDMAAAVKRGLFRADLFYRLNVIRLTVAPLRQRGDDLEILARHFLEFFKAQHHKALRGYCPAALAALQAHLWPGNVRELRNAVEHAVIFASGKVVHRTDLPPDVRAATRHHRRASLPPTLEQIQTRAILRALSNTGGSTKEAALQLNISQRKVQYLLARSNASSRSTSPL